MLKRLSVLSNAKLWGGVLGWGWEYGPRKLARVPKFFKVYFGDEIMSTLLT